MKKAKTGPKPMDDSKFLALLEWVKRGESVSQACKRHDMPGQSTFHKWRASNERNEQLYREALAYQPDDKVDAVFPMLDRLFDGVKVDASARLGRARLLIQHTQWLAARRDPKNYGAQVAGEGNTKFVLDYDADSTTPTNKAGGDA